MSTRTRVTYGEFDAMIRRGDFAATDDRFELLDGEIVTMPLPEPPHENLIDELTEWSFEGPARGLVRVRVQQTLGIPALDSLTLPDVAWMRRRDYSKDRPLPDDVLLIIEVADTTLSRDRNRKGKLYATAGIPDDWIVNVKGRNLEIRREPEGGRYRRIETLRPGDVARPLALPDAGLPVSRLFPG